MTAKKVSGRFKYLLVLFFCCGSVAADVAEISSPAPAPTALPTILNDGIRAEVSSPQAANGSIVVVSVFLPEKLRGDKVSGTLSGVGEEIKFPFFPVPERGEGSYDAILGIPYASKPGPAKIEVVVKVKGDADRMLLLPITVQDGNYPSEQLSVSQRYIEPSKQELKRILSDKKEVGAIYNVVTRRKQWSGPFVLPIKSEITSPFGKKRVFNGQLNSFHGGLDLKAPEGTPIYAPAGGKVVLAKDLFFSGNTVLIDHGYGVFTVYAHMSRIKVKKGRFVERGTLLGLSGKTGRVSGPHLHWQAVIHKEKVDPLGLTTLLR
ncbi:MAG: M23 family metallopeptidase [Bdellovibrionota bacterium]